MITSSLLQEAIDDAKTVRATTLAKIGRFPPMSLGTFQIQYNHGVEVTRSLDWKSEWDNLKVGDVVEVEVSDEETTDCIIREILENNNFTVPIPSTKKIFILRPWSGNF